MKQKLFSRDFTLVVIGQIISLSGNAAVRFALPLYLLNQTGSSALFGTVTACALIPLILLTPAGGIIADRVDKRNIMVLLDFFTAAVILIFIMSMDKVNLVILLTAALMLLYGIAGTYQPAVQACIPALVEQRNIVAANSVINMVSSFASLTGPVLGGILYSAYGLKHVLRVCAVCFAVSAIMEMFIRIPFVRQGYEGDILGTAKKDLIKSIRFVQEEKPFIGRVLLVICGINLFLSAVITVGLPCMITEVLELEASQANRLYGFAEGALAAGGLMGGICAGIFAEGLKIRKAGNLIIAAALCIFPMGASLLLVPSGLVNYLVMTVCCFVIMVCSTVFTVQMTALVQTETPPQLIGKVISVILTGAMCAQPLGNALYGVMFEICRGFEFAVFFFAGAVSLVIAVSMKKIFKELDA